MQFFKNLFKSMYVHSSSLHQMTEAYFALQTYLLKLENETNAIDEKVLLDWTNTNDYSLQKKAIYRQIRDYDNKSWVFKIWDWWKGSDKQVEVKKKWLAFQSYKKLLRGTVYPEPLLALSEKKLFNYIKARRRIPSALKSLLNSFSQSLQRFSADQLTLKDKLNATLHILNSGRYIMYGKKLTHTTETLRNSSHRINQNEDKEIDAVKNSLHQIYFLCGMFDLNYSDSNLEVIHRRYSEYLEMLKKFNKEKDYIEIESLHLKLVSMHAFLNQPDKQKLCAMIKKDEAESLNEVKIHGLELRAKYTQYITAPADKKSDDKPQLPSDALVVFKQNAQAALPSACEIVNDKVLVANFIRACGFYGIVTLDNSAIHKLTKAHRAMQMKIHPDKVNRDFEFKGQNIPIRISLDSYLQNRSEFFDRLNLFFNLRFYANKTINFNTLRQYEKSINYDMGLKTRKEFDSSFKIAESQHDLYVESEKGIYELARMNEELSQAMDKTASKLSNLESKIDALRTEVRNRVRFENSLESSDHSIKQKIRFFAEPISARSIDSKQESAIMRRKSI